MNRRVGYADRTSDGLHPDLVRPTRDQAALGGIEDLCASTFGRSPNPRLVSLRHPRHAT
jgi:hypothetical protein